MKIEIVITAGVVAVVGAIISFACMIVSWSQARDSRKNLKMQTELFEARRPNFRIKDILDSYALTELGNQFVNIKICSLITNLSDKPLTIKRFACMWWVRNKQLYYCRLWQRTVS